MNVAILFAGYHPTPMEAMQVMDELLGDSMHTYISTLYHVDNDNVSSMYLFVLNSDAFRPLRRDGSAFNAPEVMFFVTPGVAFEDWRHDTAAAHANLMTKIRFGDTRTAGIEAAEYEDGSIYILNNANVDIAHGFRRLELNAYTSMVAYGNGEIHTSVAMPVGTRFVRMLSVENGRYLDGILYESSRDRNPGDGRFTC